MLQLPAIFLVFTFYQYIYFQSIYLNLNQLKFLLLQYDFSRYYGKLVAIRILTVIWQVAGLSILWYVGSPQSKEGDERKEEKMDMIIKMLDPELHMKLKIKYFK